MEMTRRQRLWVIFVPILDNLYDFREHPEHYVPDCDMERMVEEIKRGYGVTPEEWADLEKQYGLARR